MDLLTSDAGTPRPARSRPELPAGARAVTTALVVVLLAGLGSLTVGDSTPDAGARVPTALPAGEIPGTLLVVDDTGTRVVERADPPRLLLDEPLRQSRQLAGGVVVGLADGAAVAVTPGSATTLGPAD